MGLRQGVRQFFFPSITPGFLTRTLCIGVLAYLFFGYVCLPFRIKGISMEPTYHDGGFNFCWRPSYLFSQPRRHDVVAVRFAGNRVMLLKRVVALEKEEFEFIDGKLFVDRKEIAEPYVRYPYHWNLPPRLVEKGSVYVVGDNRDMPIEHHYFGQTSVKRILGAPLW
ncbi:MAG: signal peptidase I [Deltaproteobacteria bacterium]|nr:MAG: signal peptidase I [Deltaproteobacteria bacterium]